MTTNRKIMYPGNDPENGPAEWRVLQCEEWVPEREVRAKQETRRRLRLRVDWALLREIPDALRYRDDDGFEEFMVQQGDVYNLCDEFDDDGYPTPRGVERAQAFVDRARNWTPLAWRAYHLYAAAKTVRDMLVCAVVGHDWRDDSYGGPDSGCMAAHCARCGFSFHHVLY